MCDLVGFFAAAAAVAAAEVDAAVAVTGGREGGQAVGIERGPGDRLAGAHLHSLAERADSQGRTYRAQTPLFRRRRRYKSRPTPRAESRCILRVRRLISSDGLEARRVARALNARRPRPRWIVSSIWLNTRNSCES